VARALSAPLDLLLVRKIGVPGRPELAAGAVVDGDAHEVVFNDDLIAQIGLRRSDFDATITEKLAEIESRRAGYLAGRTPLGVEGRSAVVVDDGIATGATVRAALAGLRRRNPAEIVLAVPVAPPDTIEMLSAMVDHMICLETPPNFWAVGAHYQRFDQVSDATVAAQMAEAQKDENA